MAELRNAKIATPLASAVDLSAGVTEAVERMMETTALRQERAALMNRYCAGEATAQEIRRYRSIRLALSLHRSAARRPDIPPSIDEALRRRAELTVELLVGPEVAGPPVAS